ncbi:hypothetical protein DFH08DRAFT_944467 [Mycena albidolilacea]|uniref:Uncharacterized protein n=1 Tax=Mycena albidolilacea TaxID=1033008 RepID=A0AAD6Z5G1_9AGAR|nr:hypothetical protein DFH08DRAFT_944467 [Mycena albidolilacea]
MFFSKKTRAIIASLFVVEILAAPIVDSETELADGSVFYCTAVGFTGPCLTPSFTVNTCQDVPLEFANQISSFRPSLGGACTVFSGTGCQGASMQLFSPLDQGILGASDLRGIGSGGRAFNDNLNSFLCTTGYVA